MVRLKKKTLFNVVILFKINFKEYRYEFAGTKMQAHIDFTERYNNIHPYNTYIEVLKEPKEVGTYSIITDL